MQDEDGIPATPSAPAGVAPHQRRAFWGVFCLFFSVFLLSTSRERPWADARPVHQAAHNLVRHGTLHVTRIWPPGSPAGRGGRYYAVNPILPTLVHVPGAFANRVIMAKWPAAAAWSTPLTSHLGPAAAGALACALFFLLALAHRTPPRMALAATAVLGLATSLWVYARSPYSEIVQAAAFTGFLLALLRVENEPTPRRALVLGLAAGLLVNSKLAFALSVLAAAGLLAGWFRQQPRLLLRLGTFASLGLLPGLGLAASYNWLRWGSIFSSGYSPFLADFFHRGQGLVGLWGFLVSPGTSVFLYSPPLVLSLWGLGTFWRTQPRWALAVLGTTIPIVLLHAWSLFWHGGWNWGPRYLVFALPAFALPALTLLSKWRARPRWRLQAALLTTLVAAGVVVQVAGNAFYWDHFQRIVLEARTSWLGQPNRAGSIPGREGATCLACFEDMHATNWLPPFSPVAGHLWLLRHVPFGHSWRRAAEDAPWTRETRLVLPIEKSYAKVRLDWWGLDYTFLPGARLLLFLGMLAPGLAGGVLLWLSLGQRRARSASAGGKAQALEP